MTDHAEPSTRHAYGMSDVLHTIMPAMTISAMSRDTQKRLRIFGISLKKFERSTSLIVAAHVMLYEKRWDRIACETGMERPPKKKKLDEEEM